MTYSPNVTVSSSLSGTFFSGVLPTRYEKSWENHSSKETNAHFRTVDLFHSDSRVKQKIRLRQLLCSSPHVMTRLYVNTTFLSDVDRIFVHRKTGIDSRHDNRLESDSHRFCNETTQVQKDNFFLKLLYSDIPTITSIHFATETAKNYRTQDQKLYQYKLWLKNQFDDLAQLEDNWDEHGSKKPTDLTLTHAKHVINTLLDLVTSAKYQWHPPFISSDEDGNITAVWYDGERQLHFLIGEDQAEFFRVWGTNINNEMEVNFLLPNSYIEHWKWLVIDEC